LVTLVRSSRKTRTFISAERSMRSSIVTDQPYSVLARSQTPIERGRESDPCSRNCEVYNV
jgi:hypothetical protein